MDDIEKAQRILEGRCLQCEGTMEEHLPHCPLSLESLIREKLTRLHRQANNALDVARGIINTRTEEELVIVEELIHNIQDKDTDV